MLLFDGDLRHVGAQEGASTTKGLRGTSSASRGFFGMTEQRQIFARPAEIRLG
jgi:hypothetical protein